jgi:hypothetical protein
VSLDVLAQSVYQPGSGWQALALAAAAGAGWVLRTCRRRVAQRELEREVEEGTRSWRDELAAADRAAGDAPQPCAESEADRGDETLVLAVAPPETRAAIESRLAGLGICLAAADSAWAAQVACRDAFAAGRPYNLVLLDASLEDVQEPGAPVRLQEHLQAWGARVAVIRATGGEGGRCDEDPDRRGRARLPAAAGTGAEALGPRSPSLY